MCSFFNFEFLENSSSTVIGAIVAPAKLKDAFIGIGIAMKQNYPVFQYRADSR
jgi:hypothetical protein